jgi:hypothetical protein
VVALPSLFLVLKENEQERNERDNHVEQSPRFQPLHGLSRAEEAAVRSSCVQFAIIFASRRRRSCRYQHTRGFFALWFACCALLDLEPSHYLASCSCG